MNGQVTLGIGSRSLVDVIRVTDEDSDPSELRLILKMDASNGWFEINNVRTSVGVGCAGCRQIRLKIFSV